MDDVQVIAECCCNHKGDIEIAKDMIEIAATFCQVDYVKFQKRCISELLTEEEYKAPHPNPEHAYGDTYGEHREFLEFTLDQHKELKEYCTEHDVKYSCSVWDVTSAEEIVSINPALIKIPSACNTHLPLLQFLCDNYGGDIHVSLGMTTEEEEQNLVQLFEDNGRNKDLILYACTSAYPTDFRDVCLLEIESIQDTYGDSIKAVGFSGHHLGISVDMGAIVLGAKYIERHFSLNRTWPGTDQAASLEPDGMRKLVRDTQAMLDALQYKEEDILPIEKFQRNKLKIISTGHLE